MTELLVYMGAFTSTFLVVGVRVIQQLNVMNGYKMRAFFTSYAFTALEILVVGQMATIAMNPDDELETKLLKGFVLASGSACGAVLSMLVYKKKK